MDSMSCLPSRLDERESGMLRRYHSLLGRMRSGGHAAAPRDRLATNNRIFSMYTFEGSSSNRQGSFSRRRM